MSHLFPAHRSLFAITGARKYFNSSERQRFITAASTHAEPWITTLCLTLVFTGCRISEALALTGDAIAFEEYAIAIRSLKKRGQVHWRLIPVPEDLLEWLYQVHRLEPLQSGQGTRLWSCHRATAYRHIKEVMATASIQGLHACPRGLRHGFGVHAIGSGVPLHLVQRWLGHADIATTSIYTDVIGDEERQQAQQMWE